MLKGFKEFISRGNVIDLAVAVVMGAAFGAVVTALVSDFITPIIAAIGGQPDFGDLSFTINDSKFAYGHFINAVISFLILAAAIYLLVVLPLERLLKKPEAEGDTNVRACPECLSLIPTDANRCMYCTSVIGPATPPAPVQA
ncbi:large conductance mechanosensitive channel protein MscL [Conexibacter sp. JD483]|uniref:large conductance mechanosensitive channel protein MscL n=1 Tax=unclassified Conexibacter TaxID=2627773 RepID=UPI0027243AE4|nr:MULTISPECIES: large conductance mechanosensitive channel protein MscL [unclassified Conexibacter]MDO8188554.1 large conductance mechanosensitive channel protein MscL [Conexibacter sp. CPCC 205706]MDO8199937.1 large conductance mechanosensitive channel protein MscL [Conexibacter sp. CPCC 205762]MDR9370703.1 large conductance mechanosensitive channel protein MscL [Conexibacter sp. JD483]